MPTQRISNWPRALADFMESRRVTPFKWGEHDCCLFAADAVQAITGIDLAEQYRGTYDSALGAMRILNANTDIETLIAAQCEHAGFGHVSVKFAGRGDIALVEQDGLAWAGVVLGETIAGPGETGVVYSPLWAAKRVWRIA
jgi:hypothetical protein